MTTLNAHVIALDAETGQLVWDQPYGDVRAGESATVAPLIVKDMVIVGSSGGEFGVRGHADAFKLETGERVWRCYMVPEARRAGVRDMAVRRRGLGAGRRELLDHAHVRSGAQPPVLQHGQPVPRLRRGGPRGRQPVHQLRRRGRPGQRPDQGPLPVHPARRVGLRLDDGEHPVRDGRAEVLRPLRQERVLLRPGSHGLQPDPGRAVRRSHHLGRDRRERQGDAARCSPTRRASRFTSGPARPAPRNGRTPPTARTRDCSTRPVQDVGATATRRRREFKESIPYWGAGVAVDTEDVSGYLSAIDPATGQEKWRFRNEHPMTASVLATGGDLVFAGDPAGIFRAFNASSGDLLWQYTCGSGHHSSPAPTASTDGSTSPCRSGTAPGPRGSTPERSPRRVDPRCSRSRCRSRAQRPKPYAICHGVEP